MARSEGVRAPRQDAESVRRRLAELGVLRRDLDVVRDGDSVVFPVSGCPTGLRTEVHEFVARTRRVERYQDLLPEAIRPEAPRAFEQLGDIAVVKVPETLSGHRDQVGEALRTFTGVRAVFHDAGVQGAYRVRELERIAGAGTSETEVVENGVRLRIDPGAAYYSPRLATERARVAGLVTSGAHLTDLFGGVAPQGVQAAIRGAVVETIDLNPAACALARLNAAANGLQDLVRVWEGDARDVAPRIPVADRLVMNLPHGGHAFLDLVDGLLRDGGHLHYHEILPRTDVQRRSRELAAMWKGARALGHRTVRTYSAEEDHVVFDVRL